MNCEITKNGDDWDMKVSADETHPDYVKVVRCKKCKWYEVSEFVTDKNEALGYCNFHTEPWWENEYCSHGERR